MSDQHVSTAIIEAVINVDPEHHVDGATQSAITEAVRVDQPVVVSAATPDVARRALLFSVVFLLLNFAEEGLKTFDLPAAWALSLTTLATGVIFALRQFFLLSQQMGKSA